MATPAAVLSVLLEVNSSKAAMALHGVQGQLQTVSRHATETEASTGRLGRGFGAAGAAASKAEGGFRSVGSRIANVGSIAAGTSLGVAAVGVASVNASLKFQKSMLLVHTQAGYAQRDVNKLTKSVLAMGPKVGFGPDQLAQALFHIASSGVPASKAMTVLTAAAKGARVGAADLVSTTNALVGILRTAPKDVKGAADAMGTLSAIVGQGNMRMDDLTAALSTGVLPSAKLFGLGLKDVGAALDTMTARGMPAEQSATRLRMTFSMLGAPTKAAAGALSSIGLNSTQLALDMRKPEGLVVALADLKKHLDDAGLSSVQQAQVMSKAFGGGRTSAGITLLMQNIDDLKKHTDALSTQNGTKALDTAFAKTQADAASNMERIKAALQTFEIQAGIALQPVIMWLSRFIQQMMAGKGAGGQFASAIKTAFGIVKGVITTVVGAFGGLGNALKIALAAFAVKKIFDFIGAIKMMGGVLAANPWTAAFIVAMGVIVYWIDHIHQILRGMGIWWHAIWTGIKDVINGVESGVLHALGGMLNGIASVFGAINVHVKIFGHHIDIGFGGVASSIRNAARHLEGLPPVFKSVTDHAVSSNQRMRSDFAKTYDVLAAKQETYANVSKSIQDGIRTQFAKGAADVRANTTAVYASMFARLRSDFSHHLINQQQFNAAKKRLQAQQNTDTQQQLGMYAKAFYTAMTQSTGVSYKGALAIRNELNSLLKPLGATLIPAPISVSIMGLPASGRGKFATGGLFQVGRKGVGGRDQVPMNVGGVPIMVGEGEQVAVFTRHQQAVANQALAGYGGLPGLFNRVNKPNYMATGGYVYPFPSTARIGRTDQGIDATMPPGSPIGAIGPAQVMGVQSNWYAGQPLVWEKLVSGPMAGRYIYLAEQITNIAAGLLNANSALARYASSGTGIEMGWATSSGRTLAQATTGYTEGQVTPAGTDFHNFIMGLAHGIIAGGGGARGAFTAAVWKNLLAPNVKGGGLLSALVRAGLGKATAAANAYGRKKSNLAGAFAGQGGGNAANEALGHRMMLAAGWPESEWPSLLALWMQESGWSSTAVNPTSGAYGIPQSLGHGHPYALGDAPAQIAWGLNYIRSRYGSPSAAEAHERANNWYARGGFLRQFFQTGGLPLYSGFGSQWVGPRSRQTPPRPKGGTSIGLKALAGTDMGPINKAMTELNNLIGDKGDIAQLTERYTAFDSLFQALHPNMQYLVQPADGSAAYIDNAAVQDALAELLQLQAWEQQVIADYHRVQVLVPQVLDAIAKAADIRRRFVRALQARIRANLTKIAALEKLIAVAQKAKNTTLVTTLKKQVGVLKSDNAILGGDRDKVGTTGRIGALNTQIAALSDRYTSASDMLVTAQGLTGAGGGLADANITMIGLQTQIKPLQDWVNSKGGDLAAQLAATVQTAGGPTQDSTLAAQLALQEQLTTQAQQALAVSQAQYSVLQSFPFAGSFAGGGIVPGPVGSPQVAIVHGGEAIGQPGEVTVNLHFANGMEWLRGLIRAEVASKGRVDAGLARRGLPGAGGGI